MYSYYTAGTGGVGPTILDTTFLLAGEPTIAYRDGKKYILPPVSEPRTVDFGKGLGRKGVWLYNLPEVKTGHEVLRVPSVSARFGTSPFIWNWGTWLVARLAPKVRNHALSCLSIVGTLAICASYTSCAVASCAIQRTARARAQLVHWRHGTGVRTQQSALTSVPQCHAHCQSCQHCSGPVCTLQLRLLAGLARRSKERAAVFGMGGPARARS